MKTIFLPWAIVVSCPPSLKKKSTYQLKLVFQLLDLSADSALKHRCAQGYAHDVARAVRWRHDEKLERPVPTSSAHMQCESDIVRTLMELVAKSTTIVKQSRQHLRGVGGRSRTLAEKAQIL